MATCVRSCTISLKSSFLCITGRTATDDVSADADGHRDNDSAVRGSDAEESDVSDGDRRSAMEPKRDTRADVRLKANIRGFLEVSDR